MESSQSLRDISSRSDWPKLERPIVISSHPSVSLAQAVRENAEGTEVAVHSRLAVLCSTSNGFDIAGADLMLRGPGEMRGTRQAGLPDLLIADLSTDEALLIKARVEAAHYLEAEGTDGASVGG